MGNISGDEEMKQITSRGWMLAAGLCLAVAAHAEDAPAPAPVAELSSAPTTPASPVDAAAADLRGDHRDIHNDPHSRAP